jgi:nucleotide-binding universal stress UspA family protein
VFTQILCPVDFSEDSERALATALALARATGGHLTLLTVVDPLLQLGAEAAGAAEVLDRQTQTELSSLLERTMKGHPLPSVPAVSVTVGEPAPQILAQADDCNADVIVMGRRGIGGPQKLFLGSTSERVLRDARIPVLVVPPPGR